MKNLLRLLGIIALVAAIGFNLAGCGGDDGGGSDTPDPGPTTNPPVNPPPAGTVTEWLAWQRWGDPTESADGWDIQYSTTFDMYGNRYSRTRPVYALGTVTNGAGLNFIPIGTGATRTYSVAVGNVAVHIPSRYNPNYDPNNADIYVDPSTDARLAKWEYYDVTTIPDNVFKNANIASVTFHPALVDETLGTLTNNTKYTLRTIGVSAFESSKVASTFNIPDGVTSIGSNALKSTEITGLTVPSSVTTIGTDAFKTTTITTLTYSASTIIENLFKDTTDLVTVTLNQGVATIGTNAFENCNKITTLTIPSSVTNIGADAFKGCSTLANLTYAAPTVVTGMFSGLTSLTTVTFTPGVVTIGANAFSGCTSMNLYYVLLPSTVTTIGTGAFKDTAIVVINIPTSVTSVGVGAFENMGPSANKPDARVVVLGGQSQANGWTAGWNTGFTGTVEHSQQ